ncbi:MAG: hypothetical protein HYW00_00150, partial [Candidatus Colwellbacteria bacterium]|nr:hypothetical protein [Candidatus Colwellbacteria bacterium]
MGNDPITGTCSGTTITGCEFRIYDISNPTSPAAVGGLNTGVRVRSVFVAGNYAYIFSLNGSGSNDLHIIDVSTPSAPTIVGGMDLGESNVLYVAGKYAYLGLRNSTGNEFRIADISGLHAPAASIGSIATNYLSVSERVTIDQGLYVGGGLSVGPGGIQSGGPLSIISSAISASTTALDIRNASGTSLFLVRDDGNVGIGTTSPSTTLHVVGTGRISATSTTAFQIESSSTGLTFDSVNNRLGIGISTPGQKVDASGALAASGDYIAIRVGETTFSKDIKIGLVRDGTTSYPAIWLNQASPSVTNYAFLGGSTSNTIFNAPSGSEINFRINNATFLTVAGVGTSNLVDIAPGSTFTTGNGLRISGSAISSGKFLNIDRTNTGANTAFTGDLALINFDTTWTGGVGLNSTGNLLDVSRAVTLNNSGNTHTISGAVVNISDSSTQTAGTLTHTADVLDVIQNYTSNSGAALNVSTAGTG